MATKITKKMALNYHHKDGRPGKIGIVPTKPYSSQSDISLAYSPGVAYPCNEIKDNPADVYRYTNKGNLVAVVSNCTAVLGLGDIGPLAGKPVMEGKAQTCLRPTWARRKITFPYSQPASASRRATAGPSSRFAHFSCRCRISLWEVSQGGYPL